MSHFSSHDRPFIVSGSLFVAAVVLDLYLAMFELPIAQYELLDWVSWILSIAGAIIFVSALINYRHR